MLVMTSCCSSPCNCTAVRPTCSATSHTRSAASFTNTPTFSTEPGKPEAISRACSGVMRRGLGAKTNPTALAPAFTAARASSRFVVPQILIHITGYRLSAIGCSCQWSVATESFLAWNRTFRLRQHFCERLAGMLGTHQRFADQERFEAGVAQPAQMFSGLDAALGHAQHPWRNQPYQAQRGLKIHVERPQVAVIDADDLKIQVERAAELVLVVDFAQHVQLELASDRTQVAELGIGDRRDNQQDTVSAMGPRLQHLELVDDEVLAQAGQRN